MYLKNNGDYKKYQFSSQSKRELDYHKIEKFMTVLIRIMGLGKKLKSLIDTETLSHQQQEVDYEDDDDLAFEHIEL